MTTETMTITVNGETVEPGCYIDGWWGQYGASRVLSIADDFGIPSPFGRGWYVEAETAALIAALEDGEPRDAVYGIRVPDDELTFCETVGWMADEAESALNAATIGGVWEWVDGELFLTARRSVPSVWQARR